ncbi:MAG: glycoside hydrolase family 15 protein [Alphaproteobacteria bacterium]|nr:glycoside hydrolase family 15 protein [Alphaproteobacteria bacterium]
MTEASLDLAVIGNCNVSALIDRMGRFVWACAPRPDSDPCFGALLNNTAGHEAGASGLWDIALEDCAAVEQDYLRNTAILRTILRDERGGAIEILDFSPRFRHHGRMYRPIAFVRIVRPLAGAPRIAVRLRPLNDWGAAPTPLTSGSNHIRYVTNAVTLRLTTNAPVSYLISEQTFRVERELAFFLGPDESFARDVSFAAREMLENTAIYWREWVRGLALPLEWQEAVIRAAIALKLCWYEETGAIVAALTTSIPEAPGTSRNWDYRYCWLRDAYYVIQALTRLGAADILEGYLSYLRNLIDASPDGTLQPVYGIGREPRLDERTIASLPGYRGNGPVRAGNEAYLQKQHDVYGQVVLSAAHAFFDERLLRPADVADFEALERIGARAYQLHETPDAGLWELRTMAAVHTYSAVMCWAACDRLANIADHLSLNEKQRLWRARADEIRERILDQAWREDGQHFAATFGGTALDASLLQIVDVRFLDASDPRFANTMAAIARDLVKGRHVMRYTVADDFGLPENAFNICTFWYVEALFRSGAAEEARGFFENMLAHRTRAGLLSEDIAIGTGELWGNYPQTYSLVGIINSAMLLSKPWSSVR